MGSRPASCCMHVYDCIGSCADGHSSKSMQASSLSSNQCYQVSCIIMTEQVILVTCQLVSSLPMAESLWCSSRAHFLQAALHELQRHSLGS